MREQGQYPEEQVKHNTQDELREPLQNDSSDLAQNQLEGEFKLYSILPSQQAIPMRSGQHQLYPQSGQSVERQGFIPPGQMPSAPCRVRLQVRSTVSAQQSVEPNAPSQAKPTSSPPLLRLQSEQITVSQAQQRAELVIQQKIIMVVDDSQTVRNIMALILHRVGYRSIRVASAIEALHTLTELIPDLIFLDITLPGMDGLDVCKIIKENPRTKHVPVIMLSGNSEIFDKVMGRLAGASDYITKPFEPETILNCINTFCGQKSRSREELWQGVR